MTKLLKKFEGGIIRGELDNDQLWIILDLIVKKKKNEITETDGWSINLEMKFCKFHSLPTPITRPDLIPQTILNPLVESFDYKKN